MADRISFDDDVGVMAFANPPSAGELVQQAIQRTGLDDFGGGSFEEGLQRLVEALEREAQLTELGVSILTDRLVMLLANRLRIEDVYRRHPDIEQQTVEGPVFIIGLPRTGTTALSQLVAMAPEIRSLRLWESTDPVPPPESSTQDQDPRIATAEAGLQLMYEAFPKMRSLYFQTAGGPTECQDLLGMEMRTTHFDGMAHVPTYVDWAMRCDMAPAYRYHRRTLQLLQWHCPPRLWHLKTPVHMLSLDALSAVYPESLFIWTHRDPAAVLGSVCSLISYTRSWVSDRDESLEIGAQQASVWSEAVDRAMRFRERVGERRFADVFWGPLHQDPIGSVVSAFETLGLEASERAKKRIGEWASAHVAGSQGVHEYALQDFGLEVADVRKRFSRYLERFEVPLG